MEIKPFGKHVIIEPLEAPEKMGQIYLSDEQREGMEKRACGMVAAVGPKVNEYMAEQGNPPLEAGQIVVFWLQGVGTIQGRDLKQNVFCPAEAIVGLVVDDKFASERDLQEEIKKGERKEREALERRRRIGMASGAGGIMVPPPSVPRIVE